MSKLLNSTRWEHMLEAAQRIVRRMPNVSLADFLADEDLQDIALRRFMVIGEAASHVSTDVRERFPQVDWQAVRGMRNFVAHEYFRVDLDDVWDAVVSNVPSLLIDLPVIIAQVKAEEQANSAGRV